MTDYDAFNDSLDDLLSADFVPSPELGRKAPPADFVADRAFVEGCAACGGSGKFRSWGGRVVGDCFKCKGAGKRTFKSSPEARAKGRESAAVRREKQAIDHEAAVETWKVEHAEVWAWIEQSTGRFDFARSMNEALHKWGSLTPNQLAACERSVDKRKAAQAEREAAAPVVSSSKLEKAFATAREKATRTGQMGVMMKPLRLTSGDVTVSFVPGSPGSQWEGMIFAKNADGKKLGHVKGGKFFRKFVCEDTEAVAVVDCINDPEKAAVAFGKAWSRCGVCGQGLLNDESIARGIGPICAERFGW